MNVPWCAKYEVRQLPIISYKCPLHSLEHIYIT